MTNDQLTFSVLLLKAVQTLKQNEIDTPELDARLLLEAAGEMSHAALISNGRERAPKDVSAIFEGFIERRIMGEPVHRILGFREFYGRDFQLSKETLVPRDDTEILVEEVLNFFRKYNSKTRILEIGTGSGIIAVTLASELPDAEILATDISDDALRTAKQNAVNHNVDKRIAFKKCDLFDGVSGKFDAIVSNPPYIPASDILELSREVQKHDPIAALDGGQDGLDFYRKIFASAPEYLIAGGQVLVEIGIGQSTDVVEIATSNGFVDCAITKDYSGIERVISASLSQ